MLQEVVNETVVLNDPLITNDATILGFIAIMLGVIFYTANSSHHLWKKFYGIVPAVLLCYFLPSLLNTFGVINGDESNLYYVASRYLLPACLVLLTLSVDLKGIAKLGNKAVILFLTGTLGIVIGGPIALLIVSSIWPELLNVTGPEAVWRGMTTVAGSWIGGGANQAAMKEIYGAGDQIFSAMVTVDVIVANLWMAVLLIMASKAKSIDAKTGADTSAIEALKNKVESFNAEHSRIPQLTDIMIILSIGLGVTGFAHLFSDNITPYFIANYPDLGRFSFHSKFFWMIVFATTVGLILSFTKARNLEGVGASKVGSSFLYILIATIGMKMDIRMILDAPVYFILGAIWMLIHAGLMLVVAKLIKAPLFYMAVGSQANVGGAASAPIVASSFHPSLAPVGVLLAVLGYTVGTYMAWLCGQILQSIG
ncbi:DUF819 family protein [Pseudocolwellia sp. AS88]|jgi:uncharacterized membrane protein|uniref:DUF819 family protein n=1 Tax=Pseudocolwellia TaxID=2848177 RepID=UPI0026F23784|nr:DUF819 family protein [Pseudocolwellia sp. AS88]MDO7084449.1 DUF819 family protein [Pseudocolwellia sp. AS88]